MLRGVLLLTSTKLEHKELRAVRMHHARCVRAWYMFRIGFLFASYERSTACYWFRVCLYRHHRMPLEFVCR